MKGAEQSSGLSFAYIPISKVSRYLEERVFNRPLAHKAKLELLEPRLSRFIA